MTSIQDKIQLSQFALDWMGQVPSSLESLEINRLQKLVWQNKINCLMSVSLVVVPFIVNGQFFAFEIYLTMCLLKVDVPEYTNKRLNRSCQLLTIYILRTVYANQRTLTMFLGVVALHYQHYHGYHNSNKHNQSSLTISMHKIDIQCDKYTLNNL